MTRKQKSKIEYKSDKQAKTMEHKIFTFSLSDLDAEGRTLEGYASTFGNVDHTSDIIHAGAFAKTIVERGNKIKFLWNHETSEVLGKIQHLAEDTHGLFMRAIISDTTRGRDALALLKDGAVSEMSIGFTPVSGGTNYERDGEGKTVRHLKEIKLYEISITPFPANESAVVTALKEQLPGEEQEISVEDSVEEITVEETVEKKEIVAKEMGPNGPIQRLGDVLIGSIHQTFTNLTDSWYIQGFLSQEERKNMSGTIGKALDILNEDIPAAVANTELQVFPLMGLFSFANYEEEKGSEPETLEEHPPQEEEFNVQLVQIERIKNMTVEV